MLLWLNLITLFPVRLSRKPDDSANGENVSKGDIYMYVGDVGICVENADRGREGVSE